MTNFERSGPAVSDRVDAGRTGPSQTALTAAAARTAGLGAAGWLAGMAYGLVTCAALTRGLHRSGAAALGPADRVTLTRATLVGSVSAASHQPADGVLSPSWTPR